VGTTRISVTAIANDNEAASSPIVVVESAGLIKVSSDSQRIYNVQSTLPSQLSNDSVNTPKEQLGSGLIRQKYRDLGYGFESQSGDVLSVLYTGRLVDGTIFDTNTTAGKPEFSFSLGSGQVIKGFDLGLIGASIGDSYHLEIPASLGYGARETGSIPANSTLLFDVEIRGISRGSSQLTYQNAIGNTADTFTLKKDGIPIHAGTLGSEWSIIAAERINEVNQVLWKNKLTNKLLVWAFDSSWNWTSSSALIDPSTGRGKEVESQFGVDINSDGSILVYKTGTTSASVDVMTGSSTDEFFAPLGVGTTGVDRIILGGGKNQIQLQASSGANLYTNSKESDFLVVEDFNALADQLLLAPTQSYDSFLANLSSASGLAIYEDKNKDKQYNDNDDEVIVWLKGVTAMPVISLKPTQQVYTEQSQISYKPTGTVSAPLLYTTSSGDPNLSGLSLNVHYNSSILTPTGSSNGVTDQLPAEITSTAILPDANNSDNDPLTDKIIQLLWATSDNSFPNKTLQSILAKVSFNTSAARTDSITGQPLSTSIRYTASETAAGYDFLTSSTSFKVQQYFNLDVDGDGKVTALGDGLMVIRKLFGAAFAGDALTYKAISPNATRTTAEISDFIQQGIDEGLLDMDKDGKTTALGDGLMVIRRLFGAAFEGSALTNKAISPNSPYFGQTNDFNSIGINVDALRLTIL